MLTEKQKQVIDLFKSGKSFCITGPAGTGKSYIISEISKICKSKDIMLGITALTGTASYLIRGQTIHRWGGLGLGKGNVDNMISIIKMKNMNAKKRWLNTKVLIIDEISMMSAELFEKIEKIARILRRNEEFFGGIQVILSGDFAQLEPVNADAFCFESSIWKNNVKNIIYFNEILRQSDPVFEKLLCEIRLGIVTDETRRILDSRKVSNPNDARIRIESSDNISGVRGSKEPELSVREAFSEVKSDESKSEICIIPTMLYPHKASVESINTAELQKLKDKGQSVMTYIATDYTYIKGKATKKSTQEESDMLDKSNNTPKVLELCKGAQVMLTVNLDVENGLVNGSRGVVIDFKGQFPLIIFDTGKELEIPLFTFEIDLENKKITRNQVPLMLAWAITIHKCQGATLSYVATDLSNVFCDGQAYVTLSRVKSLEGLFIYGINYNKIRCNPKVLKFYNELIND